MKLVTRHDVEIHDGISYESANQCVSSVERAVYVVIVTVPCGQGGQAERITMRVGYCRSYGLGRYVRGTVARRRN